jgi:hypothetical protein
VDDVASVRRANGASAGVASAVFASICIDPGLGAGLVVVAFGLRASIAARSASAARSRARAVRRAARRGAAPTARTGTAVGNRGGFEPA